MVGGQAADLEAEHTRTERGDAGAYAPPPTAAQLEGIHRRKTGRLLRCALTLGARIAQTDAETRNRLDCYGKCVGLAFQIADDLLDITGDERKMGKVVRKDAQHGKLTYPSLLGVEDSRRKAHELIDAACRAIAPLGEQGRRLEALAHFVMERDH
jgi:geranylgeranyl diphosphate synthase type II